MATAFYKEQAVVEIFTEANMGQARRATSELGNVLSQVGLQQMQESLAAGRTLDAASDKSFQKLQDNLKDTENVAKQGRKEALSGFQQMASAVPTGRVDIPEPEMPEFAAKYGRQLDAAYRMTQQYADNLAGVGISVGDAKTMEQDIEGMMGMEDPADRKLAGAFMGQQLQQQQESVKANKTLLEGENERLRTLKKRGAELKNEKKELIKIRDARKAAGESTEKQDKEIRSISAKIGHVTRKTNESTEAARGYEKALQEAGDNAEYLRTNVERQRGVDKALGASESKRRTQERKWIQEYREEQKKIGKAKARQNEIDKIRNKLAREYNISIESMASRFKSTLTNAIAISTGATTAFYYKLNTVVETFKEFEKELINAQSIFQTNQETLFSLSDEVVKFGTRYGINMGQASEGLYQLASAGLSAEESLMVLNNTLKLSMAVQGDHNALSKLTVQTIYGFGLQMSDSAELTDKFAHAINKSLIEWDDLASSVKFAMPFFITTGQSVDQLLGSLEILTNRALEAGIAGRGLRQALAMFAKHADDNTAAFRKMGVEIMDSEGNFKELTAIAREFSDAMGPAATDTELLTTLLEDLNVRGATAFVHLVQNVDEFEHAVKDLQNSAGAATEMADIQQQSLANQILRVQNALKAPFLLADEVGKQQGYLNAFAVELHRVVSLFEGLFVVIENGVTTGLTPLGENLRDFVIVALQEFTKIMEDVINLFLQMSDDGEHFGKVLGMITIPLRLVINLMEKLGPTFIESILLFKVMNGLLPITNALVAMRVALMDKEIVKSMVKLNADGAIIASNMSISASYSAIALSQAGVMIGMFSMIYLTRKFADGSATLAAVIGGLAGAYFGLAFALQLYNAGLLAAMSGPMAFLTMAGLVAAAAVAFAALNVAMQDMMKPPKIEYPALDADTTFDLGGRIMYDTGGRPGLGSRHKAVMVEPGETITSKTMNMLDGDLNKGITLNIHGDVYDGDNFVEKISEALPLALRNINDVGGI